MWNTVWHGLRGRPGPSSATPSLMEETRLSLRDPGLMSVCVGEVGDMGTFVVYVTGGLFCLSS